VNQEVQSLMYLEVELTRMDMFVYDKLQDIGTFQPQQIEKNTRCHVYGPELFLFEIISPLLAFTLRTVQRDGTEGYQCMAVEAELIEGVRTLFTPIPVTVPSYHEVMQERYMPDYIRLEEIVDILATTQWVLDSDDIQLLSSMKMSGDYLNVHALIESVYSGVIPWYPFSTILHNMQCKTLEEFLWTVHDSPYTIRNSIRCKSSWLEALLGIRVLYKDPYSLNRVMTPNGLLFETATRQIQTTHQNTDGTDGVCNKNIFGIRYSTDPMFPGVVNPHLLLAFFEGSIMLAHQYELFLTFCQSNAMTQELVDVIRTELEKIVKVKAFRVSEVTMRLDVAQMFTKSIADWTKSDSKALQNMLKLPRQTLRRISLMEGGLTCLFDMLTSHESPLPEEKRKFSGYLLQKHTPVMPNTPPIPRYVLWPLELYRQYVKSKSPGLTRNSNPN
jgi:hypothetical protein